MSNKFLRLVWGLRPFGNPSQRLLLAALADHADESGRCWPGEELLRAETGLSLSTINRCLHALAARGLIEIQRKAVGALHRHSLYTLHRARLEADEQREQRTPVTVTAVQASMETSSPVTVTGVQPSNETSTPVTMTRVLEPPLIPNRTPIGTIRPFRVVSKKEDKCEAREVSPFELADFVSRRAWDNFEQHRIRKGVPMDDFTRWQVQARLERFHAEGQDTEEIIKTAIVRSWTGVFPMKSSTTRFADPGITRPIQAIDKLRRAA